MEQLVLCCGYAWASRPKDHGYPFQMDNSTMLTTCAEAVEVQLAQVHPARDRYTLGARGINIHPHSGEIRLLTADVPCGRNPRTHMHAEHTVLFNVYSAFAIRYGQLLGITVHTNETAVEHQAAPRGH